MDNFDVNRKHYGEWGNSYSKNDLLDNQNYLLLKEQADNGDIKAMLDIAVGFLPETINWNVEEQMVLFPPVICNSKKYFQLKAHDTRYYFWIKEAVIKAFERIENNEEYYNDYLATACLESLKYDFYIAKDEMRDNYISSVEIIEGKEKIYYSNPDKLINELFDKEIKYCPYESVYVIKNILKNHSIEGLISEKYTEKSIEEIIYLDYCHYYAYAYLVNDFKDAYIFSLLKETSSVTG